MSTFRSSLSSAPYRFGSLTILLYFASWGIWWSFFQIWLTSEAGGLQLTGSEVGTVYSATSAAALGAMLLYGTVQDRLDLRRHLTIGIAALMTLVGPFVLWVYRPLLEHSFGLGVALGAVFLAAAFVGSTGLIEAFVERLSRRFDFEFGQARMWGSAGYAVVALAAGFLFAIDPALNFWAGSVIGLALLLIQILWRPSREDTSEVVASTVPEHTPSLRDMLGLLRLRSLWIVIVFVILSWTFYTVYDQQMFPDYYTSLFATQERGQQVYGTLNSAQVFLEALMMGLVPVLMRKVGVRTTLLLGVGVMFVRILATGLLDDPALVSIVKMLHAFEVPLFVLGIFRYITLHFRTELSATLYLVGFNISAQIGIVVLSSPLGMLRDQLGYQPTFLVIAGVVALAGIWALAMLERDDRSVHGDPFLRDSEAQRAETTTHREEIDA